MGVEPPPAAGDGGRDRRAVPLRSAFAIGRENVTVIGSFGTEQLLLRRLDERLNALAGREPAHARRCGQPLPGSWRRPDRDGPCLLSRPSRRRRVRTVARGVGNRSRRVRAVLSRSTTTRTGASNETVTGLPSRDLEPAATESCARGAHEAAVRAVWPTSQPAQTGRRTVSSTVSCSPTTSGVSGHTRPCRMRTGIVAPIGPTDDHARNTSRIPRLHDVG